MNDGVAVEMGLIIRSQRHLTPRKNGTWMLKKPSLDTDVLYWPFEDSYCQLQKLLSIYIYRERGGGKKRQSVILIV